MCIRYSNRHRHAAALAAPISRLAPSRVFWGWAVWLAVSLPAFAAFAQHEVKAPEQLRPVEDVMLFADDDTLVVNLGGVFGNLPTDCVAESSDGSVVEVVLDRFDLMVTPVGVGEATITITASNSAGSVTVPVGATVVDRPPEAVGQLPEATVTVGETLAVDVASGFSGSNLAYTVASSLETVATATVSDATVMVTGHVAGRVMLTLTVENTAGTATQTLPVWVRDQPPAAVGTLPDVTVTVGETHDVDISETFNGTALVHSVASSAPDMATATVSGTTVTLTAHAAGDVTVTVTAENSEGSANQPLSVTVKDQPPSAIGTLADTTVTVGEMLAVDVSAAFGGTALVYSVSSSAPEMATATISGTVVTLTALAAGEATITVTAENGEGSASQALAVTVKDQPPVAVGTLDDVTLTVDDAISFGVSDAFGGSALMYSVMSSAPEMATATLSGTTVMLTALAAGEAMVTVTAENTEGSAMQMFLVTVEDQLPTATGSLPNVALTTGGESTNVDAASRFDGSALVYSVAVAGEAVSASVAGAIVTVVPLVEGEATVTVTASNTAGAASLSFRATVSTDAAETAALNKGFAAIGASTLSSVTSAIGVRFRDGGAGAPALAAASAWQEGHSAHWPAQPSLSAFGQDDGWLGGSSWQGFVPGLDPAGYGSFNAAAAPGATWQQPARWTFWGHVDRQSFDGAGYDGGLTSVYVGADADFGERWLAGFAVARSVGEADYEFTSAQAAGTGDIETETLSVFPYVRWSLGEGAEAWAILGFGWGDADHVRTVTAQQGMADVSMLMASFGGRRTLASESEWDLSLLGDVSLLDMETDGGVGIVNGLNAAVSRLRAGFEAGRNIALEGGGTVTWFGQLAARHDGGDGETGAGAEVTGGLRYDSSGRFGLEAKARILAMHAADDYKENGLSVSAFVRPGPDGSGLTFSLSSHAGAGMGMAGESLAQGYGQPGVDAWRARDDWTVDARLGYSILDHRLSGLLTPFAEVDVADDRGHTMLGIALDLSGRRALDRLNVEFAGGRGYHELRGAAGGVFAMRGELRF